MRQTRFDGVQGLRFVAAFLVVVTHSTWYATQRLDSTTEYFWFGAVGVDVFFVISGFVMMVSSPTFSRDGRGAARFAYRRAIRIAPMYWLATTLKILALLVIPSAAVNAALSPGRVLTSYLFLPTRTPQGDTGVLIGVGWTLLFEMLFYALFTLGLALRRSPYVFAGTTLGAIALAGAFRGADWPVWQYYLNPVVLYFVIGMTFGKVVLSERLRGRAWQLAAALALAAAGIALLPGGFSWGSHSPFRMVTVSALVMSVVAAEPLLRRILVRPVLFLGDASYSLYLFHPLVAPLVPVVLARLGLMDNALATILSVVVALVSASVIYRYVEHPLTQWLRHREARVLRSPSSAHPTVPTLQPAAPAPAPAPAPDTVDVVEPVVRSTPSAATSA